MITYIAIYMGIGLVVCVGVLLHKYYFLNRSIKVIDIIQAVIFCLIWWPIVSGIAITELLPDADNLGKLMNKVVIKKRK